MRVVVFCHSLVSDWNNGHAHFLRGVVTEMLGRGCDVRVYEPAGGWSRRQAIETEGPDALDGVRRAFPALRPRVVDLDGLDLDEALDGADVVLVHEWNPHALVERIGRHRAGGGRYVLLFHDTHHRSVSDAAAMAAYRLEHYDGVLAFGEVIRERYLARGWSRRAWTWHEAADTRVFAPRGPADPEGDVIWIGNWGDDERSAEIRAFLIDPVRDLRLSALVHGVRYPPEAREELAGAGIRYGGWLPNHAAPGVYARYRMTVHIPRGPYVTSLPGIPTIRVFEALACGVPLISLWWDDCEGLFTPGEDFLVARTPAAMRRHMRALAEDRALGRALAARGVATIRGRHTCAHRVDQLMQIVRQVRGGAAEEVLIA